MIDRSQPCSAGIVDIILLSRPNDGWQTLPAFNNPDV